MSQNHAQHLTEIFPDSDVVQFWHRLGVESTSATLHSMLRDNTILFVQIDGMDQAKFRIPRNIRLTKNFVRKPGGQSCTWWQY